MIIDKRFENRQTLRYYRTILSQDLFGDWVVTRVWGGIGKPSGRITHIPCPTYEDGIKLIDNIAKTRLKRGYALCDNAS